jgi:tetratricopeptide (TPR) repeat protein
VSDKKVSRVGYIVPLCGVRLYLELPSRYELDAEPLLGEGGMGRVLRARDVVLDVPVALKVVRPDLAAEPRFRRLFEQEVRICARFSHPNVVPLHDYGETRHGVPFLGMALADAGSFATFRLHQPAWTTLKRLTLEVLEALAHLHARGVVHRDLKPENLLLHTDSDGILRPWLADLGLANARYAMVRARGYPEGTPGFMAPEQQRGMPREYGPWTDLYSLGVILWELTTGARPFDDSHTAADAPLPGFKPKPGLALPVGLPGVLAHLLCPDPLSRYDLAADLAREILALDGQLVVAHGDEPTTKPQSAAPHAIPARLGADRVPAWNRPLPAPLGACPPEARHPSTQPLASLPLYALRDVPMVAREEALQTLWGLAVETARAGAPRVVLVVGEAGAGKTRLVEELLLRLEELGQAECARMRWQQPAGVDDGFAGAARDMIRPWNESRTSLVGRLKQVLARDKGVYDDAICHEADALARWCGLLEPDEDPPRDELALRALYRHLEQRAWRGLVCLSLDDAMWAEAEGDGLAIAEAVLSASAEDVHSTPLFVVATLRLEALQSSPALADRVRLLEAHGACRIDLPRLDMRGTRALLAQSLTLQPHLADQVARRCEGNPLFARQILLEWTQRGLLVDTGGLLFGLSEGIDPAQVLPTHARHLFEERVARLASGSDDPARFQQIVHMTALLGRALPATVLDGLAGPEMAHLVRSCGLWVQRGATVAFDSSMLYDSMREMALDREDVAALHHELGRTIHRVEGAHLALFSGRHAMAGGDDLFASERLLESAEHGWRSGRTTELDEASTGLWGLVERQASLAHLSGVAALWRGRAHQLHGRAGQAGESFGHARVPPLQIEAGLGVGWSWLHRGQLQRAEDVYGQTLQLAKADGDRRAQALALAGRAQVEQQRRNFHGAAILFSRAAHLLDAAGEGRALGDVLVGHGRVARRSGLLAEARELFAAAIEAFAEANDPLGVARAELGDALTQQQQGRDAEAEHELKGTLAAAEQLGAMGLLMEIRLALGEGHRRLGDWSRAEAAYADHLEWAGTHALFEQRLVSLLGWARLLRQTGQTLDALQPLNRARQDLDSQPGHWLWAPMWLVVALVHADLGQEKAAYEALWAGWELGLRDHVDVDVVRDLKALEGLAGALGWDGVYGTATRTLRAIRGDSPRSRTG